MLEMTHSSCHHFTTSAISMESGCAGAGAPAVAMLFGNCDIDNIDHT